MMSAWKRFGMGTVVLVGSMFGASAHAGPSGTAAVELADGRVMLNIRHESEPRLRGVSISPDGVTGWSKVRFDGALPDPVCFGSLVRLSERPEGNKDRILFVKSLAKTSVGKFDKKALREKYGKV